MNIKNEEYKNKLKALMGKTVSGIIDRPIGSIHPEYSDMVYRVNYGHLINFYAPDGEEQDVYYLGVNEPINSFKGKVIAIIERIDDVEDKLVVSKAGKPFTNKEIEEMINFQEQFFKHRIIR